MRNIIPAQVQMGEIDINTIGIELDNRDEIPQLLRGIQDIYRDQNTRKKLYKLLLDMVPQEIDIHNGRRGMSLWRIFVLGSLRLSCNCDFDKLQELANNHITLRQMLGHGILDFNSRYTRQCLNDNLKWLTTELLDKINILVVERGMKLLDKESIKKKSHTRVDSFVVETNVHFPTDISLLWDAVRKSMHLSNKIAKKLFISGWRQSSHNLRKVKSLFRTTQKERDRNKNSTACLKVTQDYINEAHKQIMLAEQVATLVQRSTLYTDMSKKIQNFVNHGKKQIDQIFRRVFKDEVIPHHEKVFSVFEEHTEWISKGKAGKPQELGLRVCLVESATGFILHHKVMEQQTDDVVAVPITKETLARYPYIKSCSFDKGFHSQLNQKELSKLLSFCVLPRKGKLSQEHKDIENADEFKEKRKRHSAVESAINAIENHGLDRCCDRGLVGFKRYIAFAVVARNIQLIGTMLRNEELKKRKVA
jgi:hypothetical protein